MSLFVSDNQIVGWRSIVVLTISEAVPENLLV